MNANVTRPNRAAVLLSPNHVEMQDWPEPVAGPNDVVVEIAAVGVCGSDVHYFRHGRIGNLVCDRPIVLGHEAAGTVVATGGAVAHLKPGDRVTLEPQRPCGHCEQCWSGAYNLCRDVVFMATPPYHGAFARRVVNPADFTFAIPESLSFEEAALIEPLAVGLWATERLDLKPGSSVLIIGAGPIGLLAGQAAAARGATRIILSDINPARIGLVSRFPRFEAHDAAADPAYETIAEVDAVIECSGAPTAVTRALPRIRPRGGLALVGINPTGVASVDFWPAMERELSIHGVFRYAGMYPRAIALAASGLVDLKSVITHRFGLEETAAALAKASDDPSSIKSVVLP